MSWFWKKKAPATSETQPAPATIEIVAHQEAKADVIKEAHEANKRLAKLLDQNGFTIKIYLATGGHLPNMAGKQEKQ